MHVARLVTLTSPCQVEARQGEVDDGNTWNQVEASKKTPYIAGMIEGLKFRDGPMGPWEPAADQLSLFIEGLNEYYLESENLNIPIALMLDVVNTDIKCSWESNAEKDFRLEFLREHSKSK